MKRAAGLLILDGNRALLIRRSKYVSEPFTWSNPGGMLEPGEDEFEAAVRETAEEIGFVPPILLVARILIQSEDVLYGLYVCRLSKMSGGELLGRVKLNWESDAVSLVRVDQPMPVDIIDAMHPGLAQAWPLIVKMAEGGKAVGHARADFSARGSRL